MDETKRDHAQDMQEQGYDKMSDDLNKMLEDTEYEIAHNADKQLEIITSMLDKVVGQYQTAYSKINSIISSTGWVGSTDFNKNQSDLSTSTGAENQKNNASQSQSDANKNPSGAASNTKTDPIKDNAETNKTITNDVMQKENTDNRKVAEIKLSKTSVSLIEGTSTTITYTVRPNDAKNKSLNVSSDKTNVATATSSEGSITISGLVPGSATITATTADGGGISKTISVTVNKKPEPPKPPTNQGNSSGGDGIPRVGDVVTYTGRYYHDSWGSSPAGSLYAGVKNGVVIDSWSASEYGGSNRMTGGLKIHIKSADGRYGDLGWVGLNQISGYKGGIYNVPLDQFAWTGEDGAEMLVRKSDGAKLTKLNKGDGVIPADPTRRLTLFSKNLDSNGDLNDSSDTVMYAQNIPSGIANASMAGNMASILRNMASISASNSIEQHYDSLIHVDGNVDKNIVEQFKSMEQDFLKKARENTLSYLSKDMRKSGFRRSN